MSRVQDLWHRKDRTRTDRYGQGRRWMAVWTDGTGRMVRTTHATKDAAQAWIRDQDAAHATGSLADRARAARTVGELWPAWRASRVHLKPATRFEDERVGARIILPRWENTPVGRLTREDVRAWVLELTGQYAANTVQAYVGKLRAFLSWCVRERHLQVSPAERIELPKGRVKAHRYLTVEEFRWLEAALPYYWLDAVHTAVLTGPRPGELWELRSTDVDLRRRRLRVARAVSERTGGRVIGPTKTGQTRELPISDELAERLEPRVRAGGLLFTTPGGAQVREGNFTRRVWRPAVQLAGLGDLDFYDLRHTAASWAIRSGASVLTVSRMLGHASPAVTLGVYAGLFDDELDDVATRMWSVLQG